MKYQLTCTPTPAITRVVAPRVCMFRASLIAAGVKSACSTR